MQVTIYMPMIPETAIAMLACARIGAVHSVVFGGFAPKELAKKNQDAKSKIVIDASCGLEPKGPLPYRPLVDAAIKHSTHKPSSGLLFYGETRSRVIHQNKCQVMVLYQNLIGKKSVN